MVDDAGLGATVSSSTANADLLMLRFAVQASPDQVTRTAMSSLYQDALRGYTHSAAEQTAIGTVQAMNPGTG
jgi:hypothetical protein